MKTSIHDGAGPWNPDRRMSGFITKGACDSVLQPWVAFFVEAQRLADLARLRQANAIAVTAADGSGAGQ